MPKAAQTIINISKEPLPSVGSISLLPCSLAFDGPAPISTYFHPRPYVPESTVPVHNPTPEQSEAKREQPQHRQAAFRGRRLISSYLSVPKGYRGLVFSTEAAVPPRVTEDEMEDEMAMIRDERNRKAREERAAKRAKLGPSEGGEGGKDAENSTRRSPRKAAKEARERAIRAAKEKAKGKGKAAAKFSLDESSDEEEEGGEEGQAAPVEVEDRQLDEGEKTETEETAEDAAIEPKLQLEETNTLTTAISSGESKEEGSVGVVISNLALQGEITELSETVSTPSSTILEPVLVPAPAPLLTRTSTTTSTHLNLPTTPSVAIEPEPSFPFLAPRELARDEKHLNPIQTFDKIEIWNPDFLIAGGRVEEEDEVGRSVTEWIGLSAKIHAY